VVLALGLTIIAAVVTDVFHRYEMPPLAVNVVLCPLQIVVVPPMTTMGNAFTVTNCVLVDVHPLAFVTVTVYVVLALGLTLMATVVAVVDHTYDVPPLAVNVVLWPLQIVVVPVIAGVGKAFTVTVLLVVAVHPFAFVTVTV
jgi:hypothetical protein